MQNGSVLRMFWSVLQRNFRLKTQKSSAGRLCVLSYVLGLRHMVLQGRFSSHWEVMSLSFWDATLDAWVSRQVFLENHRFLATEISCALPYVPKTHETPEQIFQLLKFHASYHASQPKTQPQIHENPERFSKLKNVLRLFKFSSIID